MEDAHALEIHEVRHARSADPPSFAQRETQKRLSVPAGASLAFHPWENNVQMEGTGTFIKEKSTNLSLFCDKLSSALTDGHHDFLVQMIWMAHKGL